MNNLRKKYLKSFQRFLWSANIRKIDFQKDRVYIIHQVLAWGEPDDLRLLFKIYGVNTVKKTFLNYPKKVYTKPALKFVEILLKTKVDRSKYVSNITGITS